jgi:hypothetical protein
MLVIWTGMRGAVGSSTSLKSSLVESVKRNGNGTKVHQRIQNSVPSPDGCQDLEGTSQEPRKAINMEAEKNDVEITSNQNGDQPPLC